MTSINITKIREQEELSSRALVRKYEEEDNEALFDFIAEDNNKWPPFEISCSGVDHLNWKFWDNPIAPSIGCLAEADGRVLSFYGSTMAKACVGGKRYLARQNVDMFTRSEVRGGGLMRRVVDFYQEEVDKSDSRLSYAFPNASSHSILGRRGYRDLPTSMVEFQYIIDPRSFFGGRLALLKTTGYQIYQRLKASPVVGDEDILEDRSQEFDEQADALFERAAKSFGFIVVRDHKYLNWRYADPRSGNFVIRQFRRGDRLIGYIVLKIIDRQCYIADLLIDPEHLSALDNLLSSAKGVASEGDATIMFCRLPHGHPYTDSLKASGFIMQADSEVLGNNRMIYRTDDKEIRRALEDYETVCHLTFGDTDWI